VLFKWFDPYLKAMKAAFSNKTDQALEHLQESIDHEFPKIELQALQHAPEWAAFKANEKFLRMIQ